MGRGGARSGSCWRRSLERRALVQQEETDSRATTTTTTTTTTTGGGSDWRERGLGARAQKTQFPPFFVFFFFFQQQKKKRGPPFFIEQFSPPAALPLTPFSPQANTHARASPCRNIAIPSLNDFLTTNRARGDFSFFGNDFLCRKQTVSPLFFFLLGELKTAR